MGTKKKLDSIDFMMMDVHRPMLADEIEDIHPAALVDKAYPHEEPLGENVVILPAMTTHDLSPIEVLRNAFDAGLTELVICGVDAAGHEYLMRTNADKAIGAWYLQRAIYLLNRDHDTHRLEAIEGEES